MTRVFITGGSGFLGAHLVRACLDSGHQVTASYRSARLVIQQNPAATWLKLDLTGADATLDALARARPDVVVHLAGQSSTTRSWADPVATFQSNLIAQIQLLEACVRLPSAPRVLIASSSDVYGAVDEKENPIQEEQPLAPFSPYGASKLAQEISAWQYGQSHELTVDIVRPFLQIGPGRSDQFFSGSFARQVTEIQAGLRPPVLKVGNLELVRDMTDVRDVARAILMLIQTESRGTTYNVASEQPRTVGSLLACMLDLASVDAEIESNPGAKRDLEPAAIFGSAARLRSASGWIPTYEFRQSAADMLEDWAARVQVRAPA